MPLLLIGLTITVVFIALFMLYLRTAKKPFNTDNRPLNIALFIVSFISLAISLKLFWNLAVYADEYGSSPTLVDGGDFWLSMDWLRMGLLLIITIILGLKLIKRSNQA